MLKVIQIAKREVGYKETGNNITKYTAYFEGTDFYNGSKGDGKTWGAEWCDAFNDYCFCNAYGMETARKMLYQPKKSTGAGCSFSAQFYKDNGAFDNNPREGDQIFFYRGGKINHTGIVTAVNERYVYTIEGNSSNMVRENIYERTNTSIAGYGHPNYALINETPSNNKEEETCMITLPVLKKGSKGQAVRTLQVLLNAEGYKGANSKPLTLDGEFGNNTAYSLHNWQKANGLTPDEICGANTWTLLIT